MKKVIALLLVLVFCGSAQAVMIPTLGVCQGDNVRLRDSPGTKSRIIGKVNAGAQFIIIGETDYNGQTWYMIDHPAKKGSAYILAKYVGEYYHGNNGVIPVDAPLAQVRLTFGVTPEKTRAILGRPSSSRTMEDFTELTYPGLDLQYNENYLSYVHVTKKGYAVAGVEVGDSIKKLLALGMPEDNILDLTQEEYKNWDFEEEGPLGPEGWMYESPTGESIFFEFNYEGSEITVDLITWMRPQGEG